MEQALRQLEQCADEDRERRAQATTPATEVGAPAVLRCHQELFGARLNPTLAAQPLGDLPPLFDAAALAAFTNPASPALGDMLSVHRELTARGIDTRRTFDDGVLSAMLAARRFEQARAFAARRPHLADRSIPHVVDPLGPGFEGRSAFAYDAASNTLTRLALPSPSGTELVMVVGAGCHYSRNALQAIHDDAALQARLRDANLVLVTVPSAPVATQMIATWNAANPTLPMRAPYSAQEWRAIDVTGVPSFYLLRNGKVIGRRAGWPAEGKAELLKMLDAVPE